MSPATVSFLGRTFPPMASIVGVAQTLGYASPATAYEVARRENWPIEGPHGARKVNLIRLAIDKGIPYEIVEEPHD